MQALALKYRPKTFDDVSEQGAVKAILQNQIDTNTIKHGYLFTGPAGCGKTTAARIFANEINHGLGLPIELDAASNNSVDDIRRICDEAQTKALDSEFKVFILDEVHSLSNQAWQAFLKTLEEPPAKAIFILCTTNPEKIPATILSRVQRYNFQKISTDGIVHRLNVICANENIKADDNALEFIAKLAEGGMRDGITLLDKCISYSEDVVLDNVIKALGVADYETMFRLVDVLDLNDIKTTVSLINDTYNSGIDLKLFIKTFFEFILDINVLFSTGDKSFIKIPDTYLDTLRQFSDNKVDTTKRLLDLLVELQGKIKYEQNPKAVIIAQFILFIRSGV